MLSTHNFKTNDRKVNNTNPLVTLYRPAGKPLVLIFAWVLPTVAGHSQPPKAIIFPRKIIWTTTS